jgi:ribosomal protein L25 (general stress protein Ctc)
MPNVKQKMKATKGNAPAMKKDKSPAKKKKQGYNARLDDSLGSKNGKKSQSMKDRRDESEGMEKSKGNRKFSGNKSADRKVKKVAKKLGKKASPAKMHGKKKSPAKMYDKKSPAKMMDKKKPGKKESPVKMTGKAYDNKEAYNKNLSASARLHYLENERADDKSPMSMYGKKKSPMNMYGKKSPLEKELVGKQNNLPPELKAKIEASPAKMYGKKESPMSMSRELSYGGPVIDQEPKALSHMGASKVLKHMKGSSHSPLNMNGAGKPKEKAMQSDTVRGFSNYNVGDMVSEDDLESKFKNKGNNSKNYPQLSVQDYSEVKEDKKGKYVVRRND